LNQYLIFIELEPEILTTMKDEKPKYMQIPLCILQELTKDPKKAFELMLSYGVAYYAKNIKYSMQDVTRQVMYDFYRNQNILHQDLISYIVDNVAIDEDYSGFNGSDFNPETEMQELEEAFKTDTELRELAVKHYQMNQAVGFYNLNKIDRSERIKYVESLKNKHESLYGKQPMPSVNTAMLFSFRDNPQNIELFMAYVAIKSLIGQHNFTATNREVIVMRMIGAKSKEALELALKDKNLKAIYSKYILRYWFDKLVGELLTRNFLSAKIGFKRKIYVSTILDFQTLAVEIANFLKQRDLKKQEKQAKEIIEQHLYNAAPI